MFRRFLFTLVAFMCLFPPVSAGQSVVTSDGEGWTLENDVVRLTLTFQSGKGIALTELYNKVADCALTRTGSLLFSYSGRMLSRSQAFPTSSFTFRASDAEWTPGGSEVTDVVLSEAIDSVHLGKQLDVVLQRQEMQVRLRFQIFDEGSGIYYQKFVKNLTETHDIVIENSEVLRLDFPNLAHNLHYFEEGTWKSTSGGIEEPATGNKGKGVARCLICLYNEPGHGTFQHHPCRWHGGSAGHRY